MEWIETCKSLPDKSGYYLVRMVQAVRGGLRVLSMPTVLYYRADDKAQLFFCWLLVAAWAKIPTAEELAARKRPLRCE